MTHSLRSLSFPRRLLAGGTIAGCALAAACADAPSAPSGRPAAPSLSTTSVTTTSSGTSSTTSTSSSSSTSGSGSSGTVTVSVGPTTSVTMTIGNHRLVIPAGAICALTNSGYGPSYWDAPCTTSKAAVTITAKWYTNSVGRAVVDFQPALRFNPTKTVTLSLLDKAASATSTSSIWYCATSTSCVDESKADPSVATTRDPATGYLSRRVKHFSGYNVFAD